MNPSKSRQASVPAPASALSTAGLDTLMLALALRLADLLGEEFEALKTQGVDRFESLQPPKEALLRELQGLAEHQQGTGASGGGWPADVQAALHRCQDAHHRNECLIRHHLAVIRGTLQALTTGGSGGVDTYDRSGRVPSSGLPMSDDSA